MDKDRLIHWTELEPLCIIRLIINKLWLVIMAALMGVMAASIVMTAMVKTTYTSRVTFAVASRSGSHAYYQNINTASEVAAIYSELLESDVMRQTIYDTIGDFKPGTIKAEKVGNTNLITVTVTSDSPRESLMTLQSVIDNHGKLSEYVSSTAVLTVINTPSVNKSTNVAGNPAKMYMQYGAGGALLMMAVLFLYSATSGTIQNRTGAKNRLDAKIITTIPHEGTFGRKNKKSDRSDLSLLSPLVSFDFTEAIHRISARFEQEMTKGRRVFVFTSVYEAEGKSTVAANTALALAMTGIKVLFIDLDLRRPVQSEVLNMEVDASREFGEKLMLGEKPDAILRCVITEPKTKMDALLSSRSYTDEIDDLPFELLGEIITRARKKYDCIVIDTPPVSYFADSQLYSDHADATVLVVRQDIAPAAEINSVVDALRACRAEFIGCILNDMMTLADKGAANPYYYGHYGSKYGKYYGSDTGKNNTGSSRAADVRGHK